MICTLMRIERKTNASRDRKMYDVNESSGLRKKLFRSSLLRVSSKAPRKKTLK